MGQDEKKPVQVTITAAGNHADRGIVAQVVEQLTDVLDDPDIADSVSATIVTKIKKNSD